MLSKQEIRQRVWHLLETKNLVSFPRPCYGRIPNFIGSEKACEKLLQVKEFRLANCVFCAPDSVLRRARELALENNKVLAIATPHMKKFLEIRNVERNKIKLATTIRGFEFFGKHLETKVDIFIQGAVAVDLKGNRLGKGSGYGDKEYWYLNSRNLLADKAPVLAIVHEIQILEDFSKLTTQYDVKVNYIITPERVIACK
ncbi:MAG: 5-formyltetrahydrofolate cyclo-ligase [Candidatus Thermoplasmatota archaeon]|nr:5-formyltetrahydrofolate cyclo-ligase [Candidatus Thermoplasmatota archaeon]MDI6855157.1 5-formyltetrahydrofolate cyclo-ligase [Candidatus Thermoplasmatota archaeon]